MIDKASKKSTKELVDEFFNEKNNKNITKSYRSKIYRDEIWNYEYECQKPFTEMDTEELINLIKTFTNSSGKRPNADGYNAICYIFREFFNWYQRKYKGRKDNPMVNVRLNGRSDMKRTFKIEPLTLDQFERNISDMRSFVADDRAADYIELIYRCALEGFKNTEDILSVEECNIDFENQSIELYDNNIITISNRLMNLFIKCHEYNEFSYGRNKKQVLLRFNNSYIGIPTKTVGKNLKTEAHKMNRYLFNNGIKDMSYTDCYRLGFIEYLKKNIGLGDLRLFIELKPYEEGYREIAYKVEFYLADYHVPFTTLWAKQLLKSYIG